MIKNVILPFFLIILTSIGTVYCFYSRLPFSLFGIIGFVTLMFGNMYISFYIFYKIFPDPRNKPLPPILELYNEYDKIKQSNLQKKKSKNKSNNKNVSKTKNDTTIASVLTFITTVAMTVIGIYLWADFAGKYRAEQFKNYSKQTKAVIIDKGYRKPLGIYREYEFTDQAGQKYRNTFSNETFNIGDSIEIFYSTQRPELNETLLERYK